MNLTSFLKQIDTLTAQYSTAQLISFIHDTGRVLPEGQRDIFLQRLKAAGEAAGKMPDTDETQNSEFHKAYR